MTARWASVRLRYGALALNLATSAGGSRARAHEIVEAVWSELLQESASGAVQVADAHAARNLLLARVREAALASGGTDRLRSERALDPFDPSDPELERVSRRQGVLEAALAELDRDARALFELRFREHRSRQDAARELGVPLANLPAREHALLERLRHAVTHAAGGL